MKNSVYIGLGSNLGERLLFIEKAIQELKGLGEIVLVSSVYESMPFGYASKSRYLNLVLELKTTLSAQELLAANQNIEKKLLRRKSKDAYEDRTIDLDILFFNDEIIEDEKLKVPHPGIVERDFVIIPFMDICPNKKHPRFGKSILDLYKEMKVKTGLSLFTE